jgi:hypothetical protein
MKKLLTGLLSLLFAGSLAATVIVVEQSDRFIGYDGDCKVYFRSDFGFYEVCPSGEPVYISYYFDNAYWRSNFRLTDNSFDVHNYSYSRDVNINRNTNVNRDTNVNVNRDTNVNVNRNANVNRNTNVNKNENVNRDVNKGKQDMGKSRMQGMQAEPREKPDMKPHGQPQGQPQERTQNQPQGEPRGKAPKQAPDKPDKPDRP